MFELIIPLSAINGIDEKKFSVKSKEEKKITYTYVQKQPFYYRLNINLEQELAYLKFTGKSLLNSYPDLINIDNFHECIKNINDFKVCSLDADIILKDSIVRKCDVTTDLIVEKPVKELRNGISLSNYRKYCLTDYRPTQFAITNTVITNHCKTRMVIYGKGEEMHSRLNKPFLQSITNADYQLKYFENKIRFEVNLKSQDRVNLFFNTKSPSLEFVLDSDIDPIETFINKTIEPSDALNRVKIHSNNMKELEKTTVLCLCNLDLDKVERLMRSMYGDKTHISRAMKPYKEIFQKVNSERLYEATGYNVEEICNAVKFMVTSTLPDKGGHPSVITLKDLYSEANTDYED